MWGRIRLIQLAALAGILMGPGSVGAWAQSSHELRALLNRLTGQWEGTVSIQTLDGREIGHFDMRRVYAWSGDVLEWQSILTFPDGEHITRGRYFVRLGRLYATITRPGQPSQDYTGETLQGGLFWESALRDNRDLVEGIILEGDRQALELESFELLGLDAIPGVIRIRGLLRSPEGGDGIVAESQKVGTGTEWLDDSDPIDLFRAYAPTDGTSGEP